MDAHARNPVAPEGRSSSAGDVPGPSEGRTDPAGGRPDIQELVQQTLSCACPDEVFERIEMASAPGRTEVTVGGRLLFFLVDADGWDDRPNELAGELAVLVRAGLAARETRGLNRFRLVLVSRRPAELLAEAGAVWAGLPEVDDRVHLHALAPTDLPAVLRLDPGGHEGSRIPSTEGQP